MNTNYDEDVTGFAWTDGAPNSTLPWWVPAAQDKAVQTRDVHSLTIAELARRSRDYPHRKREAVIINGVAKTETLKQKLKRELAETEEAILVLSGKMIARKRQVEHLERFPDTDPFADGTILSFEKGFPSNPDKKYEYAAVRADGLWFVTGERSPQGITWDQFVSWLGLGVDEIWQVGMGTKGSKKVIG